MKNCWVIFYFSILLLWNWKSIWCFYSHML